ncbi:MAG TPA: hypothetical protein VMH33_09330 [Solirubrobacterales bacterium]|nr:hypothetical protein [Solirubrobacterales bacterium]
MAAMLSMAPANSSAAGPPQIPATWVTEVTATSARLWAEVDPEGAGTSYHFECLAQAAYEANLAADPPREGFTGAIATSAGHIAAGSSPVAVTIHIGSLTPETVYRYRVVADNGSGSAIGPERTLGTEAPTNAFALPDGRAWEMVSPVDKGGGSVGLPGTLFGGGDFQAAAGGGAVTWSSAYSFAGGTGAPGVSQYLSTRGGSGWSTQNVTLPTVSGAYGDHPDGAPYRLFSESLGQALMLIGGRCVAEGSCLPGYAMRAGDGALTSLPAEAAGMRVLGASSDLSRVLLEKQGGEAYEWSGGGLVPRSLLPPTAGPMATFQVASTDEHVVFYTEGGHLYRYVAGSGAADLTPAGGVTGVLGASAAGDVVYYQDDIGLWRWQGGTASEVAAGPEASLSSDPPPATGTSRVSADGDHLAFLSDEELTGYENLDASTGLPDTELYLYGPPPGGGTATLVCASCNPTGERPAGSASIPGAEVNGSTTVYRSRVLSSSGSRVFFESADSLVIADTDGSRDVYEWEAVGEGSCGKPSGCLALISSGRSSSDSTFLDASADGSDAFFITEASLVGADPGSYDVYDARVGGGLPEPESPIPCNGDACQSLPASPEDPAVGTLVSNSGNPPAKIEKLKQHHHRHKRKHRHRRKRSGR